MALSPGPGVFLAARRNKNQTPPDVPTEGLPLPRRGGSFYFSRPVPARYVLK